MLQKNINLSKYEALYEQFDGGHGMDHISRVRNLALKLAEKYLPDKLDLVYIAATLHDIGLINGRENHEINGAEMVLKDQDLKKLFSEEEIGEIAESIKQHRASSGKPQTVLAKIISDADKASDSSSEALIRAVEYGKVKYPELTYEEQIWRAAKHLKEKFGKGGTGRRTYFPESAQALDEAYKPIFDALSKNDFKFLEELTKEI